MYKGTATNLLDVPVEDVKKWLDTFDAVLTDCDGVLWLHSHVIDGAVPTINKFKEINKRVFFVTNNSTKTIATLWQNSVQHGFNITKEEIISTSHAAAEHLKNKNFDKKVYIVGSIGIAKELEAVGIEHLPIGPDVLETTLAQYMSDDFKIEDDVGAVVVGFDEHFSFIKLLKAGSYLNDPNCLFIATNTDERFPSGDRVIPGTGAIVRSVETCSERKAFVIGKPNPSICDSLINKGIIVPERTLMIGDRCNTDILLGYNCGFQTLLVGSGIHGLNDVEEWKNNSIEEDKKLIPDVYLPKLGDLLQFM